jgi:thiamine-monophosphate kinase
MNEFELITRFFRRTTAMSGVVVGIGDDGAVLAPDPNKQQVQVIDTLVEGVHFPPQTRAADIAYRAVAVNLSDIAAMGAEPRWMTLALTLSNAEEEWLESFARGLFEAADEHQVSLIGGDTTSGQAVTVTIAITGEVEAGKALLRSGARAGDSIYVTGTVGDAAAGLQLLQRGESDDFLSSRFLRPTPRIAIGRALLGMATAAIDVSDGLAGDLQKLLLASGAGAEIEIAALPLSDALCARFDLEQQLQFALQGGDDYELCFTSSDPAVEKMAGVTRIGHVTAGAELVFQHHGDVVEVDASGYRHFA